jgi:hypothetical protein
MIAGIDGCKGGWLVALAKSVKRRGPDMLDIRRELDYLAENLSWRQVFALFLLLLIAGAVTFWLFPD